MAGGGSAGGFQFLHVSNGVSVGAACKLRGARPCTD